MFTGNPASVVLDADGQSDAALQGIAREFAHAETAFIFAAAGADHDVRLRFFNARKEMPFVGHATIAAHAVLLALGRRGVGRYRQHSGTGVIDVSIRNEPSEGSPFIEFRQTVPELDAPLPFKSTMRVAEALRLPATQLHEVMPARIVRKGSSRLLVPVADERELDTLAPNFNTLIQLGKEFGADGFFVFALGSDANRLSAESRMFCPVLGIQEDPVSGNAHAMLAAYLWDLGQLKKNGATFVGHQGRHVDRPGEVRVRIEVESNALLAAHIGGNAVIVSEGNLAL